MAEQFAPGTASLSRAKRRRTRAAILTVTGVVAVCGVLLGLLGDYAYELVTVDSRLQSEQDVEDRLDRQEPPFTAVASPDTSALDGDEWTIVLDRTLNPGEVRALLALDAETDDFGRRVWRLLGPLGGRVIGATPVMPKAERHPYGPSSFCTLNLFSKRKSPVSITGMRAVNVHCAPRPRRQWFESRTPVSPHTPESCSISPGRTPFRSSPLAPMKARTRPARTSSVEGSTWVAAWNPVGCAWPPSRATPATGISSNLHGCRR
ncbi:hypothetical protein GCM10010103_37420 [Streptomyces paradoxus]